MTDHGDDELPGVRRPTALLDDPYEPHETKIRSLDDADENLPVPVAPVSAFSEDDFAPPPSTELPSARWRRRGARTILPLIATTAAAAFGMFLIGSGPYKGLGIAMISCAPIVVGVLTSLFPGDRHQRHGMSVGRGVLATFIATLLALPLVGEGAFCLLFALPVTMALTAMFSAIGVSALSTRLERLDAKARAALGLLVVLLAPLLAKPLDQALFFDPDDESTVSSTVTLPFSQAQVWNSLRTLEVKLDRPSSTSLEALLPIPTELSGSGASLGAVRRIVFDNGVVVATVDELEPPVRYGVALALENPGREFFDHWVELKHSRFELSPAGPSSTTLTHATTYRPLLYPRFVFEPLETIFGGLMQQNLVDAYAIDVLSRAPPPAKVARVD